MNTLKLFREYPLYRRGAIAGAYFGFFGGVLYCILIMLVIAWSQTP